MAKKNVAISASMTDKELLASIDKTLKNAESRFQTFATKVENTLGKMETSSKNIGQNIGKGLSDSFTNATKPFENRITQLEAQLKRIGEAKPKTKTSTAATIGEGTASIDVANLNTAVLTAARLQAIFKNIRSNTTAIRNNIDKLGQAKRSTEEQRINTIIAKRELMVQRELTYKERAISQATRLVAIERQNAIARSGKSYDAAMAMANNTIQERIDKIKALQIVQQRLNSTDKEQAAQLANVNREMQRLKKANIEAANAGIELQKKTNTLSQAFQNLGRRVLFYAGLGALGGFIKSLYSIRGEYEMLERSIGAVLGDFEKGSQIFRQQQELALKSPFTVLDLAGATKQLAAYNFQAEELVDVSRRLADISAALGVPMERLTYNLGQIRAQTVLTARDARDFANAGLPITTELAKMYTELEGRAVSVGEVMDRMSAKMVSFSDVMAVLNRYTDEGGMFFDFQAKQAETLKGQLSNLTDAYNNMLNELGKDNQGVLSDSISIIRSLFEHWKLILGVVKTLTAVYGTYRVVQLLANSSLLAGKVATDALTASQIWNTITAKGFTKSTLAAAAAQGVLGKAMLFAVANPVGVAFAALAGLISVLTIVVPKVKTLKEQTDELTDSTESLKASFSKNKEIDDLVGSYEKLRDKIYDTGKKIDELKSKNDKSEESNKKLSGLVSENEQAHVGLKKVMDDLVSKTNPSIIAQMDEYGNILSLNIQKIRELQESDINMNRTEVEKRIKELQKEISDTEKAREGLRKIYDNKKIEIKDPITGGAYYKYYSEKELTSVHERYKSLGTQLDDSNEKLIAAQNELKGIKIVTGEITINMSEWRKKVKEVTDAYGGFAADLKSKDGEDLFSYQERLIGIYRDLKKREEDIKNGLLVSPEEKERTEKTAAALREIAKALNINLLTNKEINGQKKTEMDRLKEQLSLLDKINKAYTDTIKKTGNVSKAAGYVKDAFQEAFDAAFKGSGIDIASFLTLSKQDQIKILESLKGAYNTPEAQKLLNNKIAEYKLEYTVSINAASVDSAKRKIDSIFQGYELELEIEDAGQFGSLFASLFEYDPVTFEKMQEEVEQVLSGLRTQIADFNSHKEGLVNIIATSTDDDVRNDAISQLAELEKSAGDTAKTIENIEKQLADKTAKYYADSFKQFQNVFNNFADLHSRLGEMERQRLSDQQALQDMVNKATDRSAELQLQLSITTKPEEKEKIQKEIESIEDFIEDQAPKMQMFIEVKADQDKAKAAFNEWKGTSNAWQKSFDDLSKYGTIAMQQMVTEIESQFNSIKDSLPLEDQKAFLDRIKALKKEINSRSPFAAIANQAKDLEDNFKKDNKGLLDVAARIEEIGMLASSLGNIFEQMGFSESTTDIISTTGEVLQGASQVVSGAMSFASGDYVSGAIQAIGGVWQAISGIINSRNKKITREVQKSELAVVRLENAYKNLERAVEKSMGSAEISARKAAIANQKAQLAEIEKQLELEKSRRAKDKDYNKIAQLEGQADEVRNSIKDATEDIVNTLLGSNIKDAAEQFASSWIDAWKNGEDAMASLEQNFDDMINNMIVKSLASRIVANRLQSVFDAVERATKDNTVTPEEIKNITELTNKATEQIHELLKNLMGQLDIKEGVNASTEELSGLQKGIQGITEQTAGVIEAYLNMVSGQVFQQTTLLEQISNFCNIGTATNSQILLQLRDSYQVLLAIRTWTENISTPSGNGINVRLLD